MPKSEKLKELNQRAFIKAYCKFKNAGQAYKSLHPKVDDDSANVLGCRMLKEVNYTDLLEEAGLTDALLNQKTLEGLGATKQIGARKIVQGAKTGHEIKVDAMTDTDDFIEVEDYAIRHKYLETTLKLKKRLTDKVDVTSDGEKVQQIDITTLLDKVYGKSKSNSTDEVPSNS